MELVEAVGLCCIVVTLLMFLTGISPCWKMWKTGSVRDVPFILFLMSVVSCSGMVHYGLLIHDNILVFLNIVGAVLNFIYMLVYIYIIRSKSGPLTGVFLGLAYMSALYWYCYNIIVDPDVYAHTIAKSSSSITTILILLGSIEVAANLRQKNSDGMAFIMWLGSLACGVCWLAYGLLIEDPTIYLPNIPSLIIGSTKMFIFAVYQPSPVANKVEISRKVD